MGSEQLRCVQEPKYLVIISRCPTAPRSPGHLKPVRTICLSPSPCPFVLCFSLHQPTLNHMLDIRTDVVEFEAENTR
jgi:hypothetical protein